MTQAPPQTTAASSQIKMPQTFAPQFQQPHESPPPSQQQQQTQAKQEQESQQQQQQQQHSAAASIPDQQLMQPDTEQSAHKSSNDLKQNFYNPYQVKHRRRTTKEQLVLLEETFKTSPKPTTEIRKALSGVLGMTPREVQIWFQNRRAKQKNQALRDSALARASAEQQQQQQPQLTINTNLAASLSNLLPLSSSKLPRSASVDHPQPSPSITPSVGSIPGPATAVASLKDLPIQLVRRHSDLSTPFVLADSTPASPTVAGPPSSGSANAALAAAAASAMLPNVTVAPTAATAKFPPPPPLVCSPPQVQHSMQPAYQQQQYASAMRSQKKQKRGAAGVNDGGRFHTARVHQEAFDGDNKLPLKPDVLSPNTAEDQFLLLDPSNLPNFTTPSGPGIGNVPTAYGSGPAMPNLMMSTIGGSSSNYMQMMPYASSGAHSSMQAQMPSQANNIGMTALFSSLFGPSSGAYSGNGSMALGSYGLGSAGLAAPSPASAHSSLSPTDLPFGVDATTTFYQTLYMLGQHGLQGTAHGSASANAGSALSSAGPSVAGAPSPPSSGKANQQCLPVDPMASALPGSAFSVYGAQPGQLKQQQQQPVPSASSPHAMFMTTPTDSSSSSSSSSSTFPQMLGSNLVSSTGIMGSADLLSSGSTMLYSTGTNQSTPSGSTSPQY
ncbi:hypothetical protein GGI12_000816 [Dipsacomyces acuminosporus]|nr:hypothetical protein GGI12_000816 [Dipsacomyces acuminosporus]